MRLGNWLTVEQGTRLLANVERESLRGIRNYAILAMLIGCGLRRGELLGLRVDSIQSREERWVIADLLGKAGHIRTVPIPAWVKTGVEKWMESSEITDGILFRSIDKRGRVWGTGMTPKVLWEIVKAAAARADIPKLAPHDLRRTCARLCHLAGGELDQIQFLLGTRLHPDDRAVFGLQTEATLRRQRQHGNRALSGQHPIQATGNSPLPDQRGLAARDAGFENRSRARVRDADNASKWIGVDSGHDLTATTNRDY